MGVLSIGGFPACAICLITFPYDSLGLSTKLVLSGGTKGRLKTLPEFKYAGG